MPVAKAIESYRSGFGKANFRSLLGVYNSTLTVASPTFTGANGTGIGTINLSANVSSWNYLNVAGSSTLSNVTIDIGNSWNDSDFNGPYSVIENDDITGKGSVLTLASSVSIVQTGYEAALISTGDNGDGIVNDGTITAAFRDGYFEIDATNFTNNGSISVGNDDTLYLTGTITSALVDSIETASGGIIWIDGTVSGGTITAGASNIGGYGGTLSGVTYEGTLDLGAANSTLTVTGTTFTGAIGTGTATIDLSANCSSYNYLNVAGSSTLSNTTIDIGNSWNGSDFNGPYSVIENDDTTGKGAVLTLASSVTIDQEGYEAALSSSNFNGDGIINDGAINAIYAGGYFVVSATKFTNNGDITVSNTDSLALESTAFSNLKSGTLTGGAYNVYGASVLELSAAITTDLASITLSGAGSDIQYLNGSTQVQLDSKLAITGTVYSNGGASNAYTLTAGANDIFGANGGDTILATSASINSLDSLTGGSGSNTLVLSGAGLFDLGAPQVFSNIQSIAATEGQAAYTTYAATYETLILRAGTNETVTVAAGKAASGDKGVETIDIYAGTGTHQITLSTGSDTVFLGAGTDTVIIGGKTNSVTAGSGTAVVDATVALAGASVVGNSSGQTNLDITSAGTATLNAADTYLTVDLAASSKLVLDKLGFITANGGAGSDTIVAEAANQTLVGGTADVLTGFSGGSDTFLGASAALNLDTIGNWTTGDVIDLTDMNSATLQALSYVKSTKTGTLTVQDGTHTSAITFSTGALSVANFVVIGGDGHGGTLIGYQK